MKKAKLKRAPGAVMSSDELPKRRRPSLARALRQAAKAGEKVAVASQRPDGTVVLHFTHYLDDNHSPAIKPEGENEWDSVLRK